VVGSRDLDAVRVDLGLNQWSLWGLSMGGFVSLLYAVDHPDVLDSLILDSTAASYEYARDPQSMWPAVTASARRGTPVLQAMREAQQDDPIAVTAAAIADLETNTDALGVILDRLVEYDVRPRLAEIRCPALILAGEHDRQCTPRQAQELADGMPQATLRLYADIGHGVLHTGRRDVRDAVVAFVTDAAARSARR
jgi:pimeloyl-ACP methyl ester carboxylesterase